ncbi:MULTISPECIES: hypothetical protein [Neobacillus]|uniref:Uncharacterized protein n=1 Tax=Neobacillus rhizophilus TaxID=2833579 RepID=A0A942UAT5_9BACI|nr:MULTISPECIES: hypothetical protein [Neobacillus]MBS4215708.1 hypothetical protein [Neobacillus rhizophilus]
MIRKITILLLGLMLFIPVKGLAASAPNILIDMHYLVVSPAEDGSTNLMNMVDYTNKSAEEYKGDGQNEAVLTVTLPEGAKDLNFLDNKIAFKQVDKGFITTTSIPGNQTMVLPYSFRMPKGKEINLISDYPVQMLQILVPEGRGSIEITGAQSTNQGLFKFDDQNYWGYSIENLKAGQSFKLGYNKDVQPKADSATQTQAAGGTAKNTSVTHTAPAFHNPGHLRMWAQSPLHRFNPHIFLIILGAIVIAGISYYAYFRRKARFESERLGADKEEKAFKLLMSKQKAILDKIIELEETFGDGKLTEEEYHAKLDAYKQHLVQVKLNLRNFVE